jgi:hypothetical protein
LLERHRGYAVRMSETEQSRQDEEGEHPEVDRAYDRARGGQVPEGQGEGGYSGPDPEDDAAGEADDEDQAV